MPAAWANGSLFWYTVPDSWLKSYLGKVYENLYTMDLICHGVPSAEFFDGYIQS